MNDIREDLKAYIDGELTQERAAEVAAAIDSDPELAQEAEFMKMLGIEIKRVAPEPAVEGRAATILKVKNAKSGFRWSPMAWPFGWQAVAGVVFVAVVASIIFPGLGRPGAALNEVAMGDGRQFKESGAATGSEAEDRGVQNAPNENAGFGLDSDGIAGEGGRGAGASTGGTTGGGGASKGRFVDDSANYTFGLPKEERSDIGRGRTESPATMPAKSSQGVGTVDKEAKTTVPMRSAGGNRLVVKNADMAVRVDSAAKAMSAAGTVAEGLGGFVISSNSNDLKGLQPSGTVVLRVPATRFDLAMQKLRALGDVTSESSNGEDVTAQVADIGARLKVLKAEEDSYITMLRAARRVSEMLEIKERLSGTRQEIESLTAQITALKDMATLSTITATFEEKVSRIQPEEEPKGGFEETWNGAVNGLQSALKFLGSVLIVIFVYSPIWLPIVGIGWWMARKNRPKN